MFNKTDRLHKLRIGNDLSMEEAHAIASDLLAGAIDTPQIVEILTLLQTKGESVNEILGFIAAMREHMTPIAFEQSRLIDLCGTGGSLPNRFNASTCVALLLGKMGYPIVKHGNRGSKRANGSIDFLDALAIPYDLSPANHQAQLNAMGATFLFARLHHPAVRHAAEARKQLSTRSIFNLIGPFCNPASPTTQIIGTTSSELADTLLSVGQQLAYETFAVIWSDIGLDECSTVGQSHAMIHQNGTTRTLTVDPTDYGIHHSLSDITVSKDALAIDNANIFRDIITHQKTDHPLSALIALNAAVIMHIHEPSIPIQYGIKKAMQTLPLITLPTP